MFEIIIIKSCKVWLMAQKQNTNAYSNWKQVKNYITKPNDFGFNSD